MKLDKWGVGDPKDVCGEERDHGRSVPMILQHYY